MDRSGLGSAWAVPPLPPPLPPPPPPMGPLGNAGAANIMTDLRCRVPLPVQRDGSLDGLPLDEAPGSSGVTPKHYHELVPLPR